MTLSGAINDTNDAGGGLVIGGAAALANTGGTVDITNGTKQFNTGTTAGVSITNSDGMTVSFTGGGLDIDTTTGAGFAATTSGTVTVQGSGNTINSSTGTALDVQNTDIGSGGLNLTSITSTGASSNVVINLVNTGTAGGLTVTGNGTSGVESESTAGGTISNKTGANAIVLNNTASVRLNDMVIGAPAAVAGEGQPDGINNITGNAIFMTNVTPVAGTTYGLTLSNVTISRTGGDAVKGGESFDATLAPSGGGNVGLRVESSRFLNIGDGTYQDARNGIDDSNTDSVFNWGSGFDNGNQDKDMISGTVYISNSMFAGFYSQGWVVENAGNGTKDSVFKNNDASTVGTPGVGNSGIFVNLDGSSGGAPSLNLLIESTNFTNIDLDGVVVIADPGTTSNVTVRGGTFTNPNGDNAIQVSSGSRDGDDVETTNVLIENVNVTAQRGNILQLTTGAGTYNATVSGGTFNSGVTSGLAADYISRGIDVNIDADHDPSIGITGDAINARIKVDGVNFQNIGVDGIRVNTNEIAPSSTVDLIITNNTFGTNAAPVVWNGRRNRDHRQQHNDELACIGQHDCHQRRLRD